MKSIVVGTYYLLATSITAMLGGQIARGEAPLWLGSVVREAWGKPGFFEVAWVATTYAMFYSAIYLIPYAFLRPGPVGPSPEAEKDAEWLRRISASWAALSILLLGRTLMRFLEALFTEGVTPWLLLGVWCLLTAFIVPGWLDVLRRRV